ncbi:hypothetical protein BEK98_42190 [Streptomyces diastatochromogenes]|uniref:Uncharacterized protein n=1 Tax=Streptomyces diastatochromogenes TaxID=42236 RepID=A0A233RYD4_STRDA|nr:hypothetical protein BEK98_42190 [Streptomyces diastatochromogenes]
MDRGDDVDLCAGAGLPDLLRGEAGGRVGGQQRGEPTQGGRFARAGAALQQDPVRPSAETIMAMGEGWVVTCPWGSGTGVSRYADATSSAGTNAARGMVRTASRRRASVTLAAWAARTRSSGVPLMGHRTAGPWWWRRRPPVLVSSRSRAA